MNLRHITWTGRAEVIWYTIRRLFIDPAPDDTRCIMGGPIDPAIHCPRKASPPDGLWCTRHTPKTGAS